MSTGNDQDGCVSDEFELQGEVARPESGMLANANLEAPSVLYKERPKEPGGPGRLRIADKVYRFSKLVDCVEEALTLQEIALEFPVSLDVLASWSLVTVDTVKTVVSTHGGGEFRHVFGRNTVRLEDFVWALHEYWFSDHGDESRMTNRLIAGLYETNKRSLEAMLRTTGKDPQGAGGGAHGRAAGAYGRRVTGGMPA